MINNIVAGLLIVNILGFIFLWKRNQNLLYAVFSLSLTLLFVLTVVLDYTQEWRTYQKQFIQMQVDKESNPETVATLLKKPIVIKQIWNPDLGIADRCTTCHLAVDDPEFKDAPEPFRYHKAAREHDFNNIGCTICHSGQGRATEAEYAHAKHISHWEYPMWNMDMVQVSCPLCHEEIYRAGTNLKGAEIITMGRKLTVENEMEIECTDCHTIRRVGEVLAPDLTEFATRTEHEFEQTHDMTHVEGHKDMYNWTFEHFLDPEKITPGNEETGVEATIMPNFELTDEQAHALTVLVFSFRPSSIPAKYQYKELTAKQIEVKGKSPFIEEFQESFEDFEDMPEGQQLFIRSNCWFCHTVDGKGGTIGPDLTHVASKEKTNTKEKILEFFATAPEKQKHPMANRLKKFSEEQFEQLADYLISLK